MHVCIAQNSILHKFQLFCGHLSSGYLTERELEIHKDLTLGEVTERAYKVSETSWCNSVEILFCKKYACHFSTLCMMNLQVLELQSWGVQLEQCQLVRYYKKSGTLGKPFDVDIVGVDLGGLRIVKRGGGPERKAQGVAK